MLYCLNFRGPRRDREVARCPNIRQLEQTMAVDLLQDDEDRCVGVRVLHPGQLQPMLATSVVLASALKSQ